MKELVQDSDKKKKKKKKKKDKKKSKLRRRQKKVREESSSDEDNSSDSFDEDFEEAVLDTNLDTVADRQLKQLAEIQTELLELQKSSDNDEGQTDNEQRLPPSNQLADCNNKVKLP